MYIKNGIFYHIHRPNTFTYLWRVGATINIFKKEPNSWNKFYDTYSISTDITNGNGRSYLLAAIKNFIRQPPDFKQQHYEEYIQLAKTAIEEQGIFIRETIFEEVRSAYFPELPSRKSCIWLMKDNAIQYWWNTLGGDKKIFKVVVTGTLHRTDQKPLINDTVSHDKLRALAFEYWTGADGRNPIEEELLFEGIVQVTEEYQNISQFNNMRQS